MKFLNLERAKKRKASKKKTKKVTEVQGLRLGLTVTDPKKNQIFFKYIPKLKEILYSLRRRAGTGSIKNLSNEQINLVNDRTHFRQLGEELINVKKTSRFSSFLTRIEHSFLFIFMNIKRILFNRCFKNILPRTKLPVFHPSSKILNIWDAYLSALIIINFFIFSVSFSFQLFPYQVWSLSKEGGQTTGFNIFIILNVFSFLLNLIITLNTAFYQSGEVIMKRKAILKNYFKGTMALDLVMNIGLIICAVDTDSPLSIIAILMIIFLFKLNDFFITFTRIEEVFYQFEQLEGVLSLVKLIGKIVIITHLLACLWYRIGAENPDQFNWLKKQNLEASPWTSTYIYSLYWAITTTATVGYGDITPQNEREISFCMCTMLVGCAMFGYSINKIGGILENLNKRTIDFKNNIKLINKYMKINNIDSNLQLRIKKYFEFTFQEEKINDGKAEELLLKKLNSLLKEEILLQTYGEILNSLPVLYDNFSFETMRRLVHKVKILKFSPEEEILHEGGQSFYIYFVSKGKIGLGLQRTSEKQDYLHVFKAGESFGEVSFFTEQLTKFRFTSINFSTVYCINKEDFLEVLMINPSDYEKYCEIRDLLICSRSFSGIKKKCLSCGSMQHFFSFCPSITYMPNTRTLILKLLYSPFQKRRKLRKTRSKKGTKLNALLYASKIRDSAREFCDNNLFITSSFSLEASAIFDDLASEIEIVEGSGSRSGLGSTKEHLEEEPDEINEFQKRKNLNIIPVIKENEDDNENVFSEDRKISDFGIMEQGFSTKQIATLNDKMSSFNESVLLNNDKELPVHTVINEIKDEKRGIGLVIKLIPTKVQEVPDEGEERLGVKSVKFSSPKSNTNKSSCDINKAKMFINCIDDDRKLTTRKETHLNTFTRSNLRHETNKADEEVYREENYNLNMELFIRGFDQNKNFSRYFPHNNIDLQMSKLKRAYDRKIKQFYRQLSPKGKGRKSKYNWEDV